MTTVKHTPGKWSVGPSDVVRFTRKNEAGLRETSFVTRTFEFAVHPEWTAEANARRIVAAVNATEFLTTEALESGVVAEMREALEAAQRLFKEALPKFDWGKSPLDANAIQLLNEVPGKVRAILARIEGAEG